MKEEIWKLEDFLLNESFQRYALKRTQEDVNYWENWLPEHADESAIFTQAKEIISFIASKKIQHDHEFIRDEVYTKLQKQIRSQIEYNRKPSGKIRIRHFWYAASAIILIGLSILFVRNNRPASVASTGQYLEVVVPEGQRSQVNLPDGTKVWLNSGTRFKYPTEFLTNSRDVYVTGEAFFNVTHHKNLPFVVHLKENLSIRVLGTEFNVKCYDDDKIIETTLVKGMIRLIKKDDHNRIVQEVNIKPNEKATYEKTNLKLVVTKLGQASKEEETSAVAVQKVKEPKPAEEVEFITAWKDNALVFHDERFEDIRVKMERWFGMKIDIGDTSLKQERFTGKFVNNETIYQILDIFNRPEPIQYSVKNKEIIISRKKKK